MRFWSYNKLLISLLFYLLCFLKVPAQKAKLSPTKGLYFNFSPCVSLYKINTNHAKNPTTKFSALTGLKKEWGLDRNHRTFFLTGVDYFFHGLGFKSYYFAPNTLKLYDKTFAYNYSLYIHELHLPLQLKFLFKRKDNRLFSSYFQLGYHLRYLLTSNLKITEDGKKVKYDSPQLKFKNPLFNEHINPFLSLSYGWQKNNIGSSKGNFFVELNFKYGFSSYYFERDYSASSLFVSSSHIGLSLGYKL